VALWHHGGGGWRAAGVVIEENALFLYFAIAGDIGVVSGGGCKRGSYIEGVPIVARSGGRETTACNERRACWRVR